MNRPPSRPPHDPAVQPAHELATLLGLTADLATALLRDSAGRLYEPVTLALSDDPRALPEQLALLLRPEPVGGYEPLVQANLARLRDAALALLAQWLATGAARTSTHALLDELHRIGQQSLAAQQTAIESTAQALAAVHNPLRAWQSVTNQQTGLIKGFITWVVGGPGRLALPQAAGLWNDRERAAARLAAQRAGETLCARILHEIRTLLERQEAAQRAASHAAARARQDLAALRRPSEQYRPWSWRCDPLIVATQLSAEAQIAPLVATLIGQIATETGAETLAVQAHALIAPEVDRLLASVDISRALELEAQAADLQGADPLLSVGRQLLQQLRAQPTWRLARNARARMESVQVTPDGQPLYQLSGLGTAAYGDAIQRMGFVQLELHIALDDLQLMRDGGEGFEELLALRNLFVLDELAEATEAALAASATPPIVPAEPVAVASPNGHTPLGWE